MTQATAGIILCMATKAKTKPSAELSKKRSDNAKALVAQGKIGGAQYGRLGGRPRKPRAAEKVAAEAIEKADEIVQVFKDIISDEEASHAMKLKAVTEWLSIENDEAKLALQEESFDASQMDRDELLNVLTELIANSPAGAALKDAIELPPDAVREIS